MHFPPIPLLFKSEFPRMEFNARGSVQGGPGGVLGLNISPGKLSLVDSDQVRPSLSGMGHILSLPACDMEAMGLDTGITDSSIPTDVIETILNAGALSTRKLYSMKWCLFESWCAKLTQSTAQLVQCWNFYRSTPQCQMSKVYLQATSFFLYFSIVMEGLLGLVKADPSVLLNYFVLHRGN